MPQYAMGGKARCEPLSGTCGFRSQKGQNRDGAVQRSLLLEMPEMRPRPHHSGGAKRHQQKCRYTPPVIDGQMRFEDLKQDARRS